MSLLSLIILDSVASGSEFSQRLPLCVPQEAINQGIKTVLHHRLIAFMVFVHAVRRLSLDSWSLGCPGSGNIYKGG